MAKQLAVKLKAEPTAFMHVVSGFWPFALVLLPVFQFMPIGWLLRIDTEVVNDG